MKTPLAVALAFSASTVLWHSSASAQQEPPAPSFAAIEAYLCTYNKGKGPDDLMKVTSKWNEWMDENLADGLKFVQDMPQSIGFWRLFLLLSRLRGVQQQTTGNKQTALMLSHQHSYPWATIVTLCC